MAKATKTIRQPLAYREHASAWFAATKELFNATIRFYFDIIQAHPQLLELTNKQALRELKRLTHATKTHPHPLIPLSTVAANIPTSFRRAAINAALGSARSFSSHLERWRKQKEKAQAKGKKFTIRPPVPPRTWNKSVTLYARQWKARTASTILLKLWTDRSWVWIKCGISGRATPDGWEMQSPHLVFHQGRWWLHTPIEKRFRGPGKIASQVATKPDMTICSVDLNLDSHLAVCSILSREGTVRATRFFGDGQRIHGLRKSLLGKIARNRSRTGIIAKGEQDNARLWAKVRHLDEQTAHLISARIMQFAWEHGASIIVFEHLKNLKPERGTYSRRSNQKRSYWLKGRIFQYTRYKGWNEAAILTSRVNPRGTSRECHKCHGPVARHHAGQAPEGYTPGAPLITCLNASCAHRDHADRNASIVIGQRFFQRY